MERASVTFGAEPTWMDYRRVVVPLDIVEVTDGAVPSGTMSTARNVATHLEQRGVDVRTAVLQGHRPPEQILQHAEQLASPLLVMGTHGRREHGSGALGSVSRSAVHRSPWPVLIVPPVT